MRLQVSLYFIFCQVSNYFRGFVFSKTEIILTQSPQTWSWAGMWLELSWIITNSTTSSKTTYHISFEGNCLRYLEKKYITKFITNFVLKEDCLFGLFPAPSFLCLLFSLIFTLIFFSSIDVMPKTIKNNTGKGAGIGRNTADREKEKNQNVRH